MTIPIIHNTADWVAVHKPAGLLVEPHPQYPSVVSLLQEQQGLPHREKPFFGVVHRLDRPVSGLVLLARNKPALRALNELFARRRIRKTYLALVEEALPQRAGDLQHYLGRDESRRRAVVFDQPGDERQLCRLHYRSLGDRPGGHLLEIHPRTGRFHQIRAQLAAAGRPIIGDTTYGSGKSFGAESIALHAFRLGFDDPLSGQPIRLELPPDWAAE